MYFRREKQRSNQATVPQKYLTHVHIRLNLIDLHYTQRKVLEEEDVDVSWL